MISATLKSQTLKLLEKTQKPLKNVNIRISGYSHAPSQQHLDKNTSFSGFRM